MNTDSHQAGPDLVNVIAQVQDPDVLLHTFQEFLNTLAGPYSEIDHLVSVLNQHVSAAQYPAIRLLEVEILLFFSEGPLDFSRIENIFKQLTFLSLTTSQSSETSTPILRMKYTDLYMDYQYLFAPKVKNVRLVDVITKKINVLASSSSSSSSNNSHNMNNVVTHIRNKILGYYLLCDSDYRTKSVLKYLNEEGQLESVSPEISLFLKQKNKLTSIQEYENKVHYLKQVFYPINVLEKRHASQLLENHLDNNICHLPRYYSSISLIRIESLLLEPGHKISLEDVLYKMIAAQKFAHGATIDQIKGFVYFTEKPPKYSDFNAHVKKVCDTVDLISARIQSSLPQ